MKLPLPKKRRYRFLLYLASLLIILTALDLLLVRIGRHITISSETTYITSPLKPDGTPDYIQSIDNTSSAGITDDNNAAPLLLAAFPETMLCRDQIYARLHMSPQPQPVPFQESYDTKIDSNGYSVYDKSADDELALCRKSLWKSADHPALIQWLQSAAHALDLLHRAAQLPRYYVPYSAPRSDPTLTLDILPNLRIGNYFGLAYAACARAMLRANSGDLDGARTDLLDVHHLARLIAQGQFPIERGVGFIVDRTATNADLALANAGVLNTRQTHEFLADLQSLPPLPDIADALYTERYAALDLLAYASRHGVPAAVHKYQGSRDTSRRNKFAIEAMNYAPTSINTAMRRTNAFYDQAVASFRAPLYTQKVALITAAEFDFDQFINHPPTFWFFNPANNLAASLIGNNHGPDEERYIVQKMQFDLTRLALALSAYHADHHTYPPSLSPLSPAYLPTIPLDLFINQPLHYQPSPSLTSYLLYSVGPNMIDDAGQKRGNPTPAHPQPDDLPISAPSPSIP